MDSPTAPIPTFVASSSLSPHGQELFCHTCHNFSTLPPTGPTFLPQQQQQQCPRCGSSLVELIESLDQKNELLDTYPIHPPTVASASSSSSAPAMFGLGSERSVEIMSQQQQQPSEAAGSTALPFAHHSPFPQSVVIVSQRSSTDPQSTTMTSQGTGPVQYRISMVHHHATPTTNNNNNTSHSVIFRDNNNHHSTRVPQHFVRHSPSSGVVFAGPFGFSALPTTSLGGMESALMNAVLHQSLMAHTSQTQPTPAETVDRFYRHPHGVTAEDIERDPSLKTPCAVCFDHFDEQAGEIVQLPRCKHWYHLSCIEPWLNKTHTCPSCRASVFPTRGEREDS